ncbi:MAG: methyltransferase domain-containing protein [Nakamurella sp.]
MTDWDGEGYEQISDLQRHLAARTLAGLAFRGDEQLLDVGCGDGFITRSIAARLPRGSVVGVDASPRMIEVARARPDPAGTDVRFEICGVLELAYARDFDVVVSFNTLHWVVDQRGALAAIARATRPDGRVVVQVVCAGSRPSVEQLAMQVSARPRWRSAFADFAAPFVHVDPAGYKDLAASAGLLVTSQQVDDVEWDFGSREAFVRWCTVGFADWTARLAADEVAQWVDDVVTAYQDTVGAAGLFRFMQMRAELTTRT